jgi:hypothetical protein
VVEADYDGDNEENIDRRLAYVESDEDCEYVEYSEKKDPEEMHSLILQRRCHISRQLMRHSGTLDLALFLEPSRSLAMDETD